MNFKKIRKGLIISSFAIVGMAVAGVMGSPKADKEVVKEAEATAFNEVATETVGFAAATVGTNRQRLQVSLSVADWGATPVEKDTSTVPSTKSSEYNYYLKTKVNGVTATMWSGWTQRCIFVAGSAQIPKLYYDVDHANFVNGDEITIESGAQFPSYEYVINGSGNNAYVLQQEVTYKMISGSWVKQEAWTEHEVKVLGAKFTLGSAANHYTYLNLTLSSYDYAGGEFEDSTWTKMTTEFAVGNILLNGSEIQFDAARQNRYRVKKNTVMLYVYSADGTGSEYTNMIIPAGVDFPSKAYHDSETRVKYVTSETMTYSLNSKGGLSMTDKVDRIKITKIADRRYRLSFNLVGFDHVAPGSDLQTDNYPTTAPIFSNVLLDGVAMERWSGMPDSRAYIFKNMTGWAFDFTLNDNLMRESIVVKAGALFATYNYLETGVESYFMVAEDTTFTHYGEDFQYGCKNTVDFFANNFLKMNSIDPSETGTGLCKTAGWYNDAKAAYNGMLENDRALFNSDAAYANAVARLQAWAIANGDAFGVNGIAAINHPTLFGNDNNTVLLVVLASIMTLFIVGFVTYRKKRISK